MVEFRLKIHPIERQLYIPRMLLEHLGPNITILPDNRSAILYRTGDDLGMVAESLEIILRELRLRVADAPREKGGL